MFIITNPHIPIILTYLENSLTKTKVLTKKICQEIESILISLIM